MGDNFLRHLISFLISVVLILVWTAGYISGLREWWFLVFGFVILYPLIYKLIDV
jgi:hypothetical protein